MPRYFQIKELYPGTLRQVRKSTDEKLFNSLVQQFHYLGYTQPVGEHLKYIASAGDRPAACLAFSSAPYHIVPRDEFIGWDKNTLEERRHLLAYNTRFLILPWVRVPHLASHLLGLSARTINKDWQALYNHPIYWLETFVDTERFAGTCTRLPTGFFLATLPAEGKTIKRKRKTDPSKPCTDTPLSVTSGRNSAMDKPEAENIYDSGKEPTVTRLLEQDDQIKKLKAKLASLTQNSSNFQQ